MMILVLIFTKSTDAAYLKFDKTTIPTSAGQTFTVDVMVDAGSDQIVGVESYITYDSTLLEAQNVTEGTYFPTILKEISAGRVTVRGFINDPATSKTGTGTLGTITFKALKDGSGNLGYYCVQGGSDSSKILKNDINSTDVIQCSQNATAAVTVGAGSAPATSITPPASLPKTGLFDNSWYLISGIGLVIVGVGTKVLFH